MFVDIIEPKKPLEAEKLFRACWRGKEEITPEICMEVLEATNFKTCMKRMLECVERLPLEKQAEFKEVVLATFQNREQPEEVATLGDKLAALGGYESELKEARESFDGAVYLKSSPDRVLDGVFGKENYFQHDFSGYDRAVFLAPKVNLNSARELPEAVDLSRTDKVMMDYTDLSGVKNIRFKEGAEVHLDKATGLPENLDVSLCDKVYLVGCDLKHLKNLTFNPGSEVNFYEAKSLPKELDVSVCSKVDLRDCSLSGVQKLTFASRTQKIASGVDVPYGFKGEIVYVDDEDLENVERIGARMIEADDQTSRLDELYKERMEQIAERTTELNERVAERMEKIAERTAELNERVAERMERIAARTAAFEEQMAELRGETMPKRAKKEKTEDSALSALWKRVKGLVR